MKIASLLPSATEIVCALGLETSLVGITHECDFPASVMSRPHMTASRISHETMTSLEIDHAVRSQLDGHGSIYDLDEKLLSETQPDLILTQELCDVCAVSYKTVEKAARIYAADATVVSLEPHTLEDIFANIKTVGQLTGTEAKAGELVDNLRQRVEAVRAKTSQAARPKVFMLEWLEPPFAPGHWVPEQVAAAGGECLLGEPGKPSITINYQQIYEAQPDIIVLIPCGYYAADTCRQLQSTFFPSNWREIPAVMNDNIWALDATSYFSRPAPRVVDGIEILGKIFHAEIFGDPAEHEATRIPRELIRFEDQKKVTA
jgi:iron complex transport system substrate-binding protein